MKRFLCLILCVSVLLAVTSACSEKPAGDAVNETAAQNTEAATDEQTTADAFMTAWDAIEAKNYDGRTFNILTRSEVEYEMDATELIGETTNDAIYERNSRVEEKFGVKITTTGVGNWDDVTNSMQASVLSNDGAYNLVGQVDFKTYAIVSNSLCGNWLDIGKVDLASPWWNSLANDSATINGRLYAATGDLCVTSILFSYAMFFNADLAENYGIKAEDLQNKVFDGTWTYDYFNSLVADTYEDVNGDGKKDDADRYGFAVSPGNNSDVWLTSLGQKLTSVGAGGTIDVVMFTDKTVTALEMINKLHSEQQGTYNPGEWLEVLSMFKTGNAIFTPAMLNDARSTLSDMEALYGILPYPKWDASQEMYYTGANDQFTVLAFPKSTPESDFEFLGSVVESLAVESGRTVKGAFYDSALKNRYSMDANTSKIIDIIMEGRLFEFAFQYGNEVQIPYMFRNCIIANTNTIASDYERVSKSVTKAFEKIAGYYGLGE